MKKRGVKRLLAIVTALVASMAMTVSAFAAEWLSIDGNYYAEAADGEGSGGGTWNWDGAAALALDNFKSEEGIFAGNGDLTITVTGSNETGTVYLTGTYDPATDEQIGDALTITGDGTLDVTGEHTGVASYGEAGSVTIDGTTVNVTASSEDPYAAGIYAEGDVNIKDATVNVDASTSTDGDPYVYGIQGANVNIDNSDVTVKLSPDGIAVLAQGEEHYDLDKDEWIKDSDGKITLTNARIKTDGMEIRDVIWSTGANWQVIAKGSGPIDLSKEGLTEEEYDALWNEMLSSGVEIVKVTPATASNTATSPKTGDTSRVPEYGLMMSAAGLGLLLLLKARFA